MPSQQPLFTASHSATAHAEQRTVLLALTADEMHLFLPGFDPAGVNSPAVRYCWLDTEGIDTCRWREALERHRPTVILTAWSARLVPEEWALAPGNPLRYICHITGGVRHVVARGLIEHGIIVTNWGSMVGHTIAEHALLMVLGALRNVPFWPQCMREGTYNVHRMMPTLRTRSLRGKRVGLHGFGAIARELVQMLKPHHVRLQAFSAPVPRNFIESHGVTYCASLEELFSHSDVLIECEGLTPATKGTVTEEILRLLPDDAVFVNVGRALITDEAALIRMAREKRLRVAVDVYQNEPQPADSAWLHVPGAFLSPHIAGPTGDLYPCCGARAMENVARFLRGEPPLDPISLQAYDRAT